MKFNIFPLKFLFQLSILLLFIFNGNSSLYANINPPNSSYYSLEKEGKIGYHKKGYDDPSDNLFTINITDHIDQYNKAWLVYEVKGVADANSISRSINDRLASGGNLMNISHNWSTQREKINPQWLKKGLNRILFSIPDLNKNIGYQIKNLRIEFSNENKEIINISQENIFYNNGNLYLKGFIPTDFKDYDLFFRDNKINLYDGEFEILIKNYKPSKKIEKLVAVSKNGKKIEKYFNIKHSVLPYHITDLDFDIKSIAKVALPSLLNTINLDNVSLSIGENILRKEQNISITTLRTKDIPALELGMVNVTDKYSGYRFLPHGSLFKKEASIKIKVDKSKLPLGYTLDDVKTYYFDLEERHWKELKKDSIDYANATIISKTTHFTDMINGVIKAPESPESAAYTPTVMSDIKAADPTSKIQIINPPSANIQGSANINYSIEIPPGKQGVQPQIELSYNSEGGSGWIGMGWDINTPSIRVDTRWGVPRYSSSKETETYLLSGEMLISDENGTPFLPHRNPNISRSSNRRFFNRQEGSFNEIVRYGNSPNNYYWVITDKSGTKYFYGGETSLNTSAILQNPDNGNIAEWYLTKIQDIDGNTISYEYDVITENVFPYSSIQGRNIYLSKIYYTGKGTDKGLFNIIFHRNKNNDNYRSNSAKYGFFTIHPEILDHITINYNNTSVRSYYLHYTEGEFSKKLLQKITQVKPNGEEFNHHTFEYYRDSNKEIYSNQPTQYDLKKDHLKAGIISSNIGFNDGVTALGGGSTNSFGINASISVGINNGDLVTKSNTFGASYNYSSSTSKGLSTLVDINGDGMPDKVFIQNGQMFYRPNLSKNKRRNLYLKNKDFTQLGFGEPIAIIGGPNKFSYTKSSNNGFGARAYIGIFGNVGVSGADANFGKATTKTYFTDVNGDGLIDIVNNGKVYFNSIKIEHNPDGSEKLIPIFTLDSNNTPNPINGGGNIDTSVYVIDPKEQEDLIRYSPLHDVIRVWEAPFNGNIHIQSTANLLVPTGDYDQDDYAKADGVYIQVQHNNTVIIPATKIDKGGSVQANTNLKVNKGDKIYFRLQSGLDNNTSNGAFDLVNWDPEISYTNFKNSDKVNVNGLKNYTYKSSEGFIVEADIPNLIIQNQGEKGGVIISGNFKKPITTDDLTIKIKATNENGEYIDVWCKSFTADQSYNNHLSASFELPALINPDQTQHLVKITIHSDSNIDWKSIKWDAELKHYKQGDYTISSGIPFPNPSNPEMLDENQYTILITPRTEGSVTFDGNGLVTSVKDRVTSAHLKNKLDDIALTLYAPTRLINENGIKSIEINNIDNVGYLARTQKYIYKNSDKSPYEYTYHDPVYMFAGKFSINGFFINFSHWYQAQKWGGEATGRGYLDFTKPNKILNRYFNFFNYVHQKLPEIIYDQEPVVIVISRSTGFRVYKADGSLINLTATSNYKTTNTYGYPPLGKSPRGPGSENFLLANTPKATIYGMGAIKNHARNGEPRPLEELEAEIDKFIKYVGIFENIGNSSNGSSSNPINNSGTIFSCSNHQEIIPNSGAKEDFSLIPIIDYGIFSKEVYRGNDFTAIDNSTTALISLDVTTFSNNPKVTITVKKANKLVYKNTHIPDKLSGIMNIPQFTFPTVTGEKHIIEAYIEDESLTVNSASYSINGASIPMAVFQKRKEGNFGGMYRHWGQFAYNAAKGRANKPIDQNLLRTPENAAPNTPQDDIFDRQVFIPMSPVLEKNNNHSPFVINTKWQGLDNLTFIQEEKISASRLGEDDIILTNPLENITHISSPSMAFAIDKIIKNKGSVIMANLGNATGNTANGSSKVKSDFMDMNGDGYPDIIVGSTIQYTNPTGGFSGEKTDFGGNIHISNNKGYALSIGGEPIPSKSVQTVTPVFTFNIGRRKNNEKDQNASQNQVAEKSTDKAKNNSVAMTGSAGINISSEETSTSWLDINGDGLPDRILGDNTIMFNIGYGFTPPVNFNVSLKQTGNSTSKGLGLGFSYGAGSITGGIGLNLENSHSNNTFVDINGDGLPDLVWTDENFSIKSRLNYGNRFSEETVTIMQNTSGIANTIAVSESVNLGATINITFPIPPVVKLSIGTGGNTAKTISRSEVQLSDIDGDGFVDYLTSTSEQNLSVRRSNIARTNKLKTVRNPLGGSFTIDYAHSPASYYHPGGKWVMSALEINDGLDLQNDGEDKLISIFTYDDGRYDRRERQFLGFGKVRTHHIDSEKISQNIIDTHRHLLENNIYRTAETEYSIIDPILKSPNPVTKTPEPNYFYQGTEKASRLYAGNDESQIYTENETEYYNLRIGNPKNNYAHQESSSFTENSIFFRPVKYTTTAVFEGNRNNKYITEESFFNQYDEYGNPLTFVYSDEGKLKTSGFSQYNYITAITYDYNLSTHILGMPKSVRVTTLDKGLMRKTESENDTQRGKINAIRNYIDENNFALTEFKYNRDGNLIKKILPENSKGQRMFYNYDYDKYGFYIRRVTDAFGYESFIGDYDQNDTGGYDYRFGIALKNKDINGNETRYAIDDVGRITSVTGPNELFNKRPYTILFEYHPFTKTNGNITPYAITKHFDPQNPGNDLETVTFTDGIGRVVQVKKDAVITDVIDSSPMDFNDREVSIVSGRLTYDGLGRVKATYLPITEELSQKEIINDGFDTSVEPSRTEFDVLDRPIMIVEPLAVP